MGYNYKLFFCLGIFLVTAFTSCEVYNPAEPIPAYIHIDKIDLATTFGQGSNSHKITDAWVYIDEQLVGCYELPATFPVLYEGSHQVKITPGIKVNGIAATRSPYPFFNSSTQTINFQKGTTVNLSATVTYTVYADFDFLEDFEGSGIAIDSSAGSDTTLQRLFSPNPNVFEGDYSGIAYINSNNNFFECVSSSAFVLPKGGANVFLELNYKCNHPFIVGVISQPPYYLKSSSLTFNPSDTWNKTYVYLTPLISSSSAASFKIFFGMVKYAGDSDSLAFMLDNLKLVY
ncbi:MAG: hypothetical protein V4608_15000 [Bacteroidota bacterium]